MGDDCVVVVGCYGTELPHVKGAGDGLVVLRIKGEQVEAKVLTPHSGDADVPSNPSYVCLHPTLPVVYAVDEQVQDGHVHALRLDEESLELTPIGKRSSKGSSCAHVTVDPEGRFLLVANYGGGPVLSFELDPETGALGATMATVEKCFQGLFMLPGENEARQEAAHPHQTVLYSRSETLEYSETTSVTRREVKALVPDLGLDCLHVLELDEEGSGVVLKQAAILLPSGYGPRHCAMHPSEPHTCFVICELTSMLLVLDLSRAEMASLLQERDAGSRKRSRVQEARKAATAALLAASTLNAEGKPTSDSVSTAAALAVHPNGKFVYCSNRMEKGNGTVALLEYEGHGEGLRFVQSFDSGGATPREMKISEDGARLFVCNQDSHLVACFSLDQDSGFLSKSPIFEVPTGSPVALASRQLRQ